MKEETKNRLTGTRTNRSFCFLMFGAPFFVSFSATMTASFVFLSRKMCCILCFVEFSYLKYSDCNLIDGHGEFCAKKELLLLDFVVKPTSKQICKQRLRLVKRRQASKKKLKEIDNELFSKYKTGASKNGITVKSKSSKRALFDDGVAEVEDTENCKVGDEGESSTTRCRPIDFIVPNSKTKMAGSTPTASKEKM